MAGLRFRRTPRYFSGGSLSSFFSQVLLFKNTRYVVVSGARQKDEDWNPEENGGFAVHGKSINDMG